MPQKTIYIPDEFLPILEKAQEEFGTGEGLGQLMMATLKKQLDDLPKVKEEVLRLQLVKALDVPAFNEVIEYRLRDFSEGVVSWAQLRALAAETAAEEHEKPLFRAPFRDSSLDSDLDSDGFSLWEDLIDDFVWNGVDGVLSALEGHGWFDKVKALVPEGLELLRKSVAAGASDEEQTEE